MFSNGVNPYNDQPVQFLKGLRHTAEGHILNHTVHVLDNVCIVSLITHSMHRVPIMVELSFRIFGRISLPSSGDVYYNTV